MARIEQFPAGWLVVEQSVINGSDSDGVSTTLISPEARESAMATPDGTHDTLGSFSMRNGDEVLLGLSEPLGAGIAEFFCRFQKVDGGRKTATEVSQPFIWFWDAIRDGDDWFYYDGAGIEHPLVRTTLSDDGGHTVEVRALEFRRYLGQRDMLGLIHRNHIRWVDTESFGHERSEHHSSWCNIAWNARSDSPIGPKTSHSFLHGNHIVTGFVGQPSPPTFEELPIPYPEFIYAIDAETGQPMSFSCDPTKLGNRFEYTPAVPDYLTNVHFDARLLDRYQDDPDHYAVSSTSVAGPNMWSISIGRTSSGDVEAYLGDIGRDLPWQELAHWRSHNIQPRSEGNEERYRRDFLGHWVGRPDPLDRLRASYSTVVEQSNVTLGWPLFRPPKGEDVATFNRLQPPTSKSMRSLDTPVLVLTKTLVDGIDIARLNAFLGQTDLRSLASLEQLITSHGGDKLMMTPLRDIQRLRSGGGIAHAVGDSKFKVFESVGIAGMYPADAVDYLASRLSDTLDHISAVLKAIIGDEQ
ncbi:hypothetical protein [Leifsonia sp. A12D58]|uniref:hypothetical protein n=1 Tax=Leifsonia sp. A12D58 TaxID=3397674 RepID=UPI0039DFDF24